MRRDALVTKALRLRQRAASSTGTLSEGVGSGAAAVSSTAVSPHTASVMYGQTRLLVSHASTCLYARMEQALDAARPRPTPMTRCDVGKSSAASSGIISHHTYSSVATARVTMSCQLAFHMTIRDSRGGSTVDTTDTRNNVVGDPIVRNRLQR